MTLFFRQRAQCVSRQLCRKFLLLRFLSDKHGNQHGRYPQDEINCRIQDKCCFPMSKNIHVPMRNSTAEITGRLHKCRMSFPANAPIITEYNGLTAKNRRKHTAIPASPFTKVTASHGNASITTAEAASHKIMLFFIISQNPPTIFDSTVRSHSELPPHPRADRRGKALCASAE